VKLIGNLLNLIEAGDANVFVSHVEYIGLHPEHEQTLAAIRAYLPFANALI
jgi:hypothetical protein